jgi:hypothetical protein
MLTSVEFLQILGGNAVLLAAAGWLFKTFLANRFARGIEQYKSELARGLEEYKAQISHDFEVRAKRIDVQFSLLHKRVFEAIDGICIKLKTFELLAGNYFAMDAGIEEKKQEYGKSAIEAFKDLRTFFHVQGFYLPDVLSERIEAILKELGSDLDAFESEVMHRAAGKANTGVWAAVSWNVTSALQPAMAELKKIVNDYLTNGTFPDIAAKLSS